MHKSQTDGPLFQWCEALLNDGNFDEAMKFARILNQEPSPKSLKNLIKIIEYNEGTEAALKALEEFMRDSNYGASNELTCGLLIAKAELLVKTDQLYPALQSLLKAKALTSNEPKLIEDFQVEYKLGSLYLRMGNVEAAQVIFSKNINILSSGHAITSTGVFPLSRKSENTNESGKANGSQLDLNAYEVLLDNRNKKTAKYVYFVAGDLIACKQFAKIISQQIDRLAIKNIHFHLHGTVTNADDPGQSENAWGLLCHKLQQTPLSLTVSRGKLGIKELSLDEHNAIVESEHLRNLARLLKHYKLPIIAASPDVLPVHDPEKLITNDFDVALMSNADDVLDIIWSTPSRLLIFSATAEALTFAETLERDLNAALSGACSLEPKIAEACLAVAKSRDNSSRFSTLPKELIKTDREGREPYSVYRTDASFVGRGMDESLQEYSIFLQEHYANLNQLLLGRWVGVSGSYTFSLLILEDYLRKNPKLTKPELFEAFQTKGLIYAHANELEHSQLSLRKAQETLPKGKAFDRARSLGAYQLGSVSAALGDFEEAQAIFDKRIEIDCDNGWMSHTGIIDLNSIVDEKPKLGSLEFLNSMNISDEIKFIYLVSANLEYCEKFAPALTEKFEALGIAGAHLHIHGIALNQLDEDRDAKHWAEIRTALGEANISSSFSLNNLGLTGLTRQQQKSVYASERFRILPGIIEKFKIPVIVADIDQLPLKDITTIIDNRHDAQFLHFPKSVLNFLSVFSATLSVFHPSEGGMALASRLKGYFDDAYTNTEKLGWHIDQAALAVLNYTTQSANIGYIDSHVVESNPRIISPSGALEKGAYFWSVTNSIENNLSALWDLESQEYANPDQ